MHTWPHLAFIVFVVVAAVVVIFVVVHGALWATVEAVNLPLVTSNRYHPMNNSPIVPIVVVGAPFWFVFFYLPAAAAAAAAVAASTLHKHTRTHCYAGYAHQRTHIYTHTEALAVNSASLFFLLSFFPLIYCLLAVLFL